MTSRSRELIVLVAVIAGLAAYLRLRDVSSLNSFQQLFAGEDAPELIVWSGEDPCGKTWENLGNGGGIDYPAGSGLDGKGKALTIRFAGEGYRGCGLNWKGWYPDNASDDASRYRSLVFHIRQLGDIADLDLHVSLVDNHKHGNGVAASNCLSVVNDGGLKGIDREWRRVVLPLARFAENKPLKLDRLWGVDFANIGKSPAVVQIDRIGFSGEQPPAPKFPSCPAYQATASVETNKPGHAISDGIYGVCGLSEQALGDYRVPFTRWGGNTSTRYNWKINADNGANDWYFKNRGTPINSPAETGYLKFAQAAHERGASTYITLPMIGWVAKDHHSYGFSVKKYGSQKQSEPGQSDVGNGVKPDGKPVTGNDPRDTSIAVGPDFVAEAVALLAERAPSKNRYYALDNEPMIWHETHRDVRPEPLGYDELWDRTVKYAEAIRKADPNAKIAGFCSWGWTDLFYSAKDEGGDRYTTKPDYRAHGSMPLGEWFIKKCGEYRKQHGRPLVDVFDLHWYPQAEHGGKTPYLAKGMAPGLNELRLRSTRDLWDPEYTQESWIRNTGDRQPTRVLRRVREWVDRHNPGMQICLGEYNFGGGDNITGGLAQADVLGTLARERIDLAFLWHTPEGAQNLAWKLFRNYDGRGGSFGETFLPTSSNNPNLSVYAAKRGDGAVTVVAINKSLGSPCELKLDLPGVKGSLRAWRFEQGSDGVEEIKSDARQVDGTLQMLLPPASASILVIK